ncbi:MAG TPA: TonB-dependent receptor [Steroidobacteraceae bacterium]|nr:TonB-dependent receptor [Steroidobacteraceae bacterium]
MSNGSRGAILIGTAMLSGGPAWADEAATAATATSPGLEEVVVTAQRRSESLERTPVAIAVIGGGDLAKQAITTEADLQAAVPGLTVRESLNSNQLNYSIRGQTVDEFSGSKPAVIPYINEIAINTAGGQSAFYDLQSVQVLKGPQGTLFGKNTTGGAVLFTTTKPTGNFGGYASASTGNYGLAQFEGAVNVPVIPDKVLARIAAFHESRSGVQNNTYYDNRTGTVRLDGVRGSLTINFTDTVHDDLVIDYLRAGGSSKGLVLYNILPLTSPITAAAPVPANILYTPALDSIFGPGAWAAYSAAHPRIPPGGIFAYLALQNARGPFTVTNWNPGNHLANNLILSNVTRWDLGDNLQFKNIFGFNNLRTRDGDDATGTPYGIDGTPIDDPYGLSKEIREFSEEPQLIGKAFHGELNYVAGLYYSNDRQVEHTASSFADLLPLSPPVPQHNDTVGRDKSYAGYGQGTYDLSRATGLTGLSATAGARYTEEKISIEQLPTSSYFDLPPPAQNLLEKTFVKTSWQFGLQEQLNSDLLLYVVTRRSFRSGGFSDTAPPLPGYGSQGGGGFDAETATDVELGAKYQSTLAGLPTRVNLALYNESIKNIQRVVYTQYVGALTALTANVPQARVRGVELEGQVNLTRWAKVGTSVAYTDARFTDSQATVYGTTNTGQLISSSIAFGPYPDTPRWSGSFFSEFTLPVTSHLEASVRGEIYDQTSTFFTSTFNTATPGAEIPGYAVANFRLGLEDHLAGWSITANVKNAFNRVYYAGGFAAANLFTVNAVVPADPRTYSVTLRYNF